MQAKFNKYQLRNVYVEMTDALEKARYVVEKSVVGQLYTKWEWKKFKHVTYSVQSYEEWVKRRWHIIHDGHFVLDLKKNDPFVKQAFDIHDSFPYHIGYVKKYWDMADKSADGHVTLDQSDYRSIKGWISSHWSTIGYDTVLLNDKTD
jgi:hypothetical protein